MYSIAFILALLAFGGLAAYLGDLLGYRLGKRRLSLLRLRPRTTARLVGVLVGLLIPGVTVGVTSLLIPEVRDAVFRIDDLHREIGSLQSEQRTVEQENASLRTQAAKERKQARESRKSLESVRSGLEQARGRLADARDRVAGLRRETERLGSERSKAIGDRDRARKDLDEAETALADAEKALTDAEAAFADASEAAEKEKERLAEEIKVLSDQLTAVREEWELQHTIFSLRHPVLDIDAELVRGVIERPATVDQLTDKLVALLVLADTAAEAGGAGPTEKGRYTRAIFPFAANRLVDEDGLQPEEVVLGEVRRQLWGSEAEENVVQVKVAGRTFAGEPARVRFEARPNKRVFAKDATIVRRRIEARQDEAATFEQLWLLIADPQSSEVRRQARDAGLLPDPKTGGYGAITIRELYAAAQECANREEPVAVRVQAVNEAYTVGPLKIRIVVEPAGGD